MLQKFSVLIFLIFATNASALAQKVAPGRLTMQSTQGEYSDQTNEGQCGYNIPARCLTASRRAEEIISNFPQVTGIYSSAAIAYCTYLVGIEVSYECGAAYDNAGLTRCSDLSYQQGDEYEKAAFQARNTMSASHSSLSEIKFHCSSLY